MKAVEDIDVRESMTMSRRKIAVFFVVTVLSCLALLFMCYGIYAEEDFKYYFLVTRVYKGQGEDPEELEFRLHLAGVNIKNVNVYSPKRKTIFASQVYERPVAMYKKYKLINSFGSGYYKIGTPIEMEKRFPQGKYAFKIKYYDPDEKKIKSKKLKHNLVGSFPSPPSIISPKYGQQGVGLEPVIQWEKAPDDTKFKRYAIAIGIPHKDPFFWEATLYKEIEDIDQTQYQVPPDKLKPNTTYDLWVGIVYEGFFESKRLISFTTTN